MKSWAIAIIVALVAALAAYFALRTPAAEAPAPAPATYQTPAATSTPPASTSTPVTETGPLRKVSLASGALVASPLTVTGEAQGTWYFEASFPVEIRDANGALVAQGHAEAQSDWMTTNFVPFKAVLTFIAPTTTTGVLILKNDNPSGDPARDVFVRIPVRFR